MKEHIAHATFCTVQKTIVAAFFVYVLTSKFSALSAADWPRFRGLHGAGHSEEKNIAIEWSASKNIVWKTELPGPGSSSPITWREHVYITCYTGYGTDKNRLGDRRDLQRHLICLNRADGKFIWQRSHQGTGQEGDFTGFRTHHGYASHTPVADEDGVYAYFATGGIAAYTHDGELRWRKDTGVHGGGFGSACSPVLHKELLIVNAMNESNWSDGNLLGIVALDKNTGQQKWQFAWAGGLCQPSVVGRGDAKAIVLGRERSPTRGYDPVTGKILWECQTKLSGYNPMAVSGDGVVFATNHGKTAAIRLGGRGDVTETHKLWELNKGSYVASPIYYEDHLYIPREDGGVVYCIHANSGRVVYEQRLPGGGGIWASPIIADEKLYYVSRSNGAHVLAAKPEFELLAHNVICSDDSQFHGTPAISRGHLFLRSDKFLYCIGEKGE